MIMYLFGYYCTLERVFAEPSVFFNVGIYGAAHCFNIWDNWNFEPARAF
jgi:hypothetical protein